MSAEPAPGPRVESPGGRRREILTRVIDASRHPHRLPELLDFVLEQVRTSIAFTWAAVWLFDREQENWYIAVSRGLSRGASEIRFPRGSALPCLVGERGSPMLVADLDKEDFHRLYPEHFRMRSAMYAPMWIARKPVGVIALYSDRRAAFSQDDLDFLVAIGHHVGVAVAFAALEEQRERLAILQERDRLARDLHDGMLQILSSVKLYLTEAKRSLATGDVGDARDLLARAHESIEEATVDIRQSIAHLRSSVGFENVLEVAHRMKHRLESAGIQAEFEARVPPLPGPVSDALASICREGTNNILKHSHARRARILLAAVGSWVELTLTDNGVGPPRDTPVDGEMHLGIQMMRERAEQLGGSLEVTEAQGGGLRLRCRIPLAQPNE